MPAIETFLLFTSKEYIGIVIVLTFKKSKSKKIRTYSSVVQYVLNIKHILYSDGCHYVNLKPIIYRITNEYEWYIKGRVLI